MKVMSSEAVEREECEHKFNKHYDNNSNLRELEVRRNMELCDRALNKANIKILQDMANCITKKNTGLVNNTDSHCKDLIRFLFKTEYKQGYRETLLFSRAINEHSNDEAPVDEVFMASRPISSFSFRG